MKKSRMARVSVEMDTHLSQMSRNLGISKTEASKLMVMQSQNPIIVKKKRKGLTFGEVMRL